MKTILLGLLAVLLSFVGFHLGANSQSEGPFLEIQRISDASATISMLRSKKVVDVNKG
jgi:hypothetical protein